MEEIERRRAYNRSYNIKTRDERRKERAREAEGREQESRDVGCKRSRCSHIWGYTLPATSDYCKITKYLEQTACTLSYYYKTTDKLVMGIAKFSLRCNEDFLHMMHPDMQWWDVSARSYMCGKADLDKLVVSGVPGVEWRRVWKWMEWCPENKKN